MCVSLSFFLPLACNILEIAPIKIQISSFYFISESASPRYNRISKEMFHIFFEKVPNDNPAAMKIILQDLTKE